MAFNDLKVISIEELEGYTPSFSRKDLYRVCLVTGESTIYFGDRRVDMSGTYMFFGNINTPYSWVLGSGKQQGYTCLFTENYLKDTDYVGKSLKSLSVFNEDAYPIYPLQDQTQIAFISTLFEKIKEEKNNRYAYQKEVISNLLLLLTHEAFKYVQEDFENKFIAKKGAANRLFSDFTALMDAQFPVENKDVPIQLNKVSDYAGKLSVHPNYLNRSVKKQTGTTVLKVINERIINESRMLLQHTDWSISEIAYALGFEYPSYFDNVFKKITKLSPKQYRDTLLNPNYRL